MRVPVRSQDEGFAGQSLTSQPLGPLAPSPMVGCPAAFLENAALFNFSERVRRHGQFGRLGRSAVVVFQRFSDIFLQLN